MSYDELERAAHILGTDSDAYIDLAHTLQQAAELQEYVSQAIQALIKDSDGKWVSVSDDNRTAICEGELCPACLGTSIKFTGSNPDGIRMNHAYDCNECPAEWEGY